MPLVDWNLAHADAGLRFQLVERHPWSFSTLGFELGAAQLLIATPPVLVAAAIAAWRLRDRAHDSRRWLALVGGVLVLGFVLLGFFADRERTSVHWTLQGWLVLAPLAAAVIAGWRRAWRMLAWAVLAVALASVLGYYTLAATPLRAQLAGSKPYPGNFAGWPELAAAVRAELATMPPGTRLLAGNFKLGAQLGFALGDPDIAVLEHPLNGKHGRAPQLALWGLQRDALQAAGSVPTLLVIAPGDVPYRELLAHYHALCRQVGPLPAPRGVLVDHGAQRFLLFRLPAHRAGGACVTPAMAWIDVPAIGARVATTFDARGWAFKDGVGLDAVELLLDGQPVARARHGDCLLYTSPSPRD